MHFLGMEVVLYYYAKTKIGAYAPTFPEYVKATHC